MNYREPRVLENFTADGEGIDPTVNTVQNVLNWITVDEEMNRLSIPEKIDTTYVDCLHQIGILLCGITIGGFAVLNALNKNK